MSLRLLCILLLCFSCLSVSAASLPSVTLEGHSDQVRALAFSPDGLILASAGIAEHTIQLWDVLHEEIVSELSGHRAPVTALAFTPAGRLVSASEDHTIKIWNPETGKLVRQLLGHHGPVLCLDISPSGEQLVSASDDHSLRLWDLETGRELSSKQLDIPVFSAKFAQNGRWIATGDGEALVRVWDAASLELLGGYAGHTDHVWTVSVSPDGRFIASGSWDGTVMLWPVNPEGILTEPARTLVELDTWILSLSFSPDGQLLAAGLLDWEKNRTVQLLDIPSGEILHSFDQKSRYSLAFSPNQVELAAAGSSDGSIHIWRSSAVQPNLMFPSQEQTIEHLEDIALEWSGDPGTVYYEVQIARDPGFSQILQSYQTTQQALDISLSDAGVGQTLNYWWRVRAGAFGSIGEWSLPGSFATSPSEGCQLQLVPPTVILETGQLADVLLRVTGASNLGSIRLALTFDPSVMYVLRIAPVEADASAQVEPIPADIENELGFVQNITITYSRPDGFTGSGNVAKVTIRALESGQTPLALTDVELVNTEQETIPCTVKPVLITVQQPVAPWDVNRDGKVNVLDFVAIGQAFGQPIVGNPEINPDVNRDGIVDVLDFSLTAQHFGEVASAPSISDGQQETLMELADYLRVSTLDPIVKEQLRSLLQPYLPTATQLGQNFPNPFNPETWIPFELGIGADVSLKIHDVRGHLVRRLDLGFHSEGRYIAKEQSVYWDGTNESGESVPSGVYFYTISTGRFSQTRKMTVVR